MGVRLSGSSRVRAAFLSFLLAAAAALPARAATLPVGFTEQGLAGGLTSPTAMTLAPDGRVFVTLQGGQIRIWDPVAGLLPTPFATIAVITPVAGTERGLLGIALDPNFTVNGFVYVYYTTSEGTIHNRLGRLTANGNVATSDTPATLVDFETLGPTNHNGGALNFGPDGMLYVATGENAIAANAQLYSNRLGKILRYDTTAFAQGGSLIPGDNPTFGGQTSGDNRAIWALGLRNPYTFAFNPGGTGPAMLINDVGQNTFEEIDEGGAGRNYGWPQTEGDFDPSAFPDYTRPTYSYEHANGACAITGGAFYAPSVLQFGGDYANDYFFADFCAGWIRRLDPARSPTDPARVVPFASGLQFPVDLRVDAAGSLYYLQRGGDFQLYRVSGTTPGGATAPTGVTADALGQLLRLSWNPAPDALGYIVEAGTEPGAADLFNGNVGGTTSVEATLPVDTYYMRVRTVTAAATSAPSSEVQATLTANAACGPPAPPAPPTFTSQVSGVVTRLTWAATLGATSYILEAGSASGLANLLSTNVGAQTALTATAPAGTYFVRVRAANTCGTSAPSPEIPVTLGCDSPPDAPSALLGSTANDRLTIVWTGALGHTSYVMEAGRSSGASDVFAGNVGTLPGVQVPLAAVPPGTYYLRVRGVSACGLGPASAELVVTVP
jgi:glucose/arabinose dehydrogenase